MRQARIHRLGLISIVAVAAMPAFAEEPPVVKVTDRIRVIQAAGNITVFEGKEGLLIVDSATVKPSDGVMAKIAEISAKPVRYLVNTHYHFDHTGGNAVIGRGARIVAHENCKKTTMANLKPGETPAGVGVPQETYTDEKILKVGDAAIKLSFFGPAHSSGDTVVVFESEKVIVAGDLFFNGIPPYIDVQNGSDTANWVALVGKLHEQYPDYKVVPGHGPVTDMAGYQSFAKYLSTLREKVAAAVKAGKSREETVATVKLDEFAEIRDVNDFGLTRSANVGWVYDEMKR